MRNSVDELIGVVYKYYPRGLLINDPRYQESEQYRRLQAARRQAGANNETWRAMLRRLGDQFPENSVENRSLHLPTGTLDACYSARLSLPTNTPGEHYHDLGILVSFLVPYYIVYSLRNVDDREKLEEMKAHRAEPARSISVFVPCLPDTMFVLPAWLAKILPARMVVPEPPIEAYRNVIGFDFSPDEEPYAAWIAQDIESSWGYERMPPQVGKVIVPDVATNLRWLGEATLYDCLFSDDW
jgi:hypothetical protein